MPVATDPPCCVSIATCRPAGTLTGEWEKFVIHRNRPLALLASGAASLLFNATPAAATEEAAVIVTASRFAEIDPRVPANISIITRKEIAELPAATLPDVLSTRAGINVRSITGSLGIDATVDLRGFGDTAASNTLILVDGLRINPIDMGSISWSAIPLAAIQRIEIMRGAGTVLFGDRASGGVINVITDKTGTAGSSVTVEAGSHGFRSIDAHVSTGNDAVYLNLAGRSANDNGWRDNNQQDQQAVAGRFGLRLPGGDVFTDFAAYRDSSGLPGYLRNSAYRDDPRDARTPDDHQSRDGWRIRPGLRFDLTSTLTLEAEIAAEQEDRHSKFASFGSVMDSRKETQSITPRLRWRHGLGTLASETIVGFDYYDGDVDSRYSAAPRSSAAQTSHAIYLQNSTALDDAWTATFGARRQRMEQEVHQDAYPAWFQPALNGRKTRKRNAVDLGVSRTGDGWRAYAKAGTTFRFANTDELFGYDNVLFVPVFAGDLKPQRGRIGEAGASVKAGIVDASASLYHLKLKDEIGYDGSAGANINFDPTRRQGLEAEIGLRLTDEVRVQFAYAYTEATFRGGPYSGNDVPLVPRHKATVQVAWNGGIAGTYTAIANCAGSRRYSGDFGNTRGMLSGNTIVDLQAAWKLRSWTLTARVINAFNKRYAPFAGYSTTISDHYYYPGDGRSIRLAARYDFR